MTDGGVGLDTEPALLPTPSLDPGPFEDFTDRVLSAHRFCVGPVRKVIEVERWGRRGDGQQGVDLVGRFCDGATAAWQCKRYAKLTPADVREFVSDCSYLADEYYLVYSGEASASVRAEIAKYPHWALVDRRGLGRLLDELPLHKRRDVLDQTWGRGERKRLLEVPGQDAFLSLAAFTALRGKPDRVPNDCGPRVGRQSELSDLGEVVGVDESQPAVVLVTGPGGRGKTRLLAEALTAFEAAHPEVPVLFASAGTRFESAALAELPCSGRRGSRRLPGVSHRSCCAGSPTSGPPSQATWFTRSPQALLAPLTSTCPPCCADGRTATKAPSLGGSRGSTTSATKCGRLWRTHSSGRGGQTGPERSATSTGRGTTTPTPPSGIGSSSVLTRCWQRTPPKSRLASFEWGSLR